MAKKETKNFRASGVIVGQKGPTATLVFAPGGRQKEEANRFKIANEKKGCCYEIIECVSMRPSSSASRRMKRAAFRDNRNIAGSLHFGHSS